MARISKYSAQAIQARQITAFNMWLEQQRNAPQPQAPEQQSTGFVQGKTATPQRDKAFTVPAPAPTTSTTTTPTTEYMAQSNANVTTILGTQGTEPVYYEGQVREGLLGTWDALIANPFKNWARRTFANINNPYDILPAPTEAQTARIEELTQFYKKNTEAAPDFKAKQFIEQNIFGIDMNEEYKIAAVKDVAKEAGVNVGLHETVKSLGAAASSIFFAVVGAPEFAVRVGSAVVKGLDETADEVAGPDKNTMQPIIDGAQKLQRAVAEQQQAMKDAAGIQRYGMTKDSDFQKLNFMKIVGNLAPIEIFKDAGRLILNLDKLKSGQLSSNINRELAGSQAVYSRIYDDAMNAEYIRRYEEGESPQKLVLEIQNPGVELVAGIALDPTTFYHGATAAKTFVDDKGLRVVQNGIKSASLNAIDDGIKDVRMVEGVRDAVAVVQKTAEGTATRQQALDTIQAAFKSTQEAFQTWKNTRGITSLTSTGKQALVMEQSRNVMQDIAAAAANHPDGVDLFTGTIASMVKMAKGEGDAKAFTALLNSPLGQLPLSPRGMRTANLLAQLDEETPTIKKLIESGDIKALANLYANKMDTIVKKSILSVEEMRGAAGEAETIVQKIGGNTVVEQARTVIKNIDAASENLNSIKTTLTETKQSVKNMLDEFKGLVKKRGGEVKYLQDVRGSIIDNADKQIADLELQLKAIKKGGNPELKSLIGEIKATLAEVRELKKTTMMEDIGKAKGTYESAKETLRVLSAKLEKNINDVVKQVELAKVQKSKALDGIKDLNIDGMPVRSMLEKLDENLKIAEDYKKLPSHVRFLNGANEAAKKPFNKFMGFFSEIYFGLNRFAYPTKNVLSANFGMAYEFGLTNALEMSTKSLVGSQIEPLGVKALEGMSKEIERLVGYVPEAFKRGPSPIGEFIKTDKKYLGLVRGGGEVAQLSEQIMGAQIMLKTVQRELKNFVRYGGVPDTKVLQDVGLHADDAKKLVQYAMENTGDASKTLDMFRKFMGGSEETFRHIQPSDRLGGFLETIGSSNNLKKEMQDLLDNAPSAEEFRKGAQAIKDKVAALAEIARSELTQLSDDIPAEFMDDIKAAQQFKYASPEAINNFERVLQGWRNSEKAMQKVAEDMTKWFRKNKVDVGAYTSDIMAIGNREYPRQDAVRKLVRKVYEGEFTTAQMWETLNSLEDFKLKNYTELDPAKVTPKEMISVMWDAYFKWSGENRMKYATDYNIAMTDILKKMAGQLGVDLPTAARMADVPYKKAADEFEYAKKLYNESQIDSLVAARRKVKPGTTLMDVDIAAIKQYGFKSLDHLFNKINKYRETVGLRKWDTFAQVDFWEVEDAVRRARLADGYIPADPAKLLGEYIPRAMPPIAPDKAVTPARVVAASMDNFSPEFDKYVNLVASKWGETTAPVGALTDDVEKQIGVWAEELTKRTNQAKIEAAVSAQATRDAMLYDYRKSLWNVAAQYVSPFHYYHASASNQWLQNVAADPKWAAIYIDYKEYMAQRHAGLPDFWKQNIAVSGLMGYDKDNPLFFNIEASVNPLYQMIGQDFNDPNRRKDWLSTTVDDLSKVVPGVFQPIQWLVAADLYTKGEDDAMRRWAGRLIPQTKLIKNVSNALGLKIPFGKYNELDPFVNILDGGLDPFEEARVNRYLAAMPGVTEEQRIEAAHSRTGEIWARAVQGALSDRALPEMASYFLGVGYKPRTSSDIQTDKFYEDYRKLIASRSVMGQDEYRDSWDALRQKYPFMDALLIGRKAGDDRDTAFAYNILSRIPPGETSDIAKFVHIEPYMLEAFYANKGDLSKMLPQDRDRFMAAMVDLSAMLQMPKAATRQEWTEAKRTYAEMQANIQKKYGDKILDQINHYYDLSENDRKDYLDTFPNIRLAMQDQTAYLANTPILAAYYGGIDTIARYYNNGMYIQLEKEFGKDIQDKVDYYYWLTDNNMTAEAKLFKAQNNLSGYFTRKDELQQKANLMAVEAAKYIPEGIDYAIRPEFAPQSGIQTNTLSYATTDQQAQMAQMIWGQLSQPTQALIQDYYNGKELPYAVGKRLEYLGGQYGLTKQEVLRLLGVEIP